MKSHCVTRDSISDQILRNNNHLSSNHCYSIMDKDAETSFSWQILLLPMLTTWYHRRHSLSLQFLQILFSYCLINPWFYTWPDQKMPKIPLRNVQDIPKISPRHLHDMPKICPKYAQDIPNMCPRYAQNNPKIFPKYTQARPMICPRYVQLSKVSQIFAQDMFKICQRIA